MKCALCGKKIHEGEIELCDSCLDFLIWKYKTLENHNNAHEEVKNE